MEDHCCQLHVHSSHSFKDGLAPEAELAARAKELGQPGIGLTNHGNLFGAPAMAKACKEHGLKTAMGIEIYEAFDHEIDPEREKERWKGKFDPNNPRYFHLTLWAATVKGWENLCALHTISWKQENKPKFQPLVSKAHLEEYSDGLICGMGCIASRVNVALNRHEYTEAREAAGWYAELFEDRLYVEVMGCTDAQISLLREQRKLAEYLRVPTLAVNDVHYLTQADGVKDGPHHTLVKARKFKSQTTKEEAKEADKSADTWGDYYGSDGFYMKNREQMEATGLEPQEIDQSVTVLNSISFDFNEDAGNPSKPEAPVPAPGDDPAFDEWIVEAA